MNDTPTRSDRVLALLSAWRARRSLILFRIEHGNELFYADDSEHDLAQLEDIEKKIAGAEEFLFSRNNPFVDMEVRPSIVATGVKV